MRLTEKQIALHAIQDLPDDCSFDEILECIEFVAAIRQGIQQLDRGDTIPHEEVKLNGRSLCVFFVSS